MCLLIGQQKYGLAPAKQCEDASGAARSLCDLFGWTVLYTLIYQPSIYDRIVLRAVDFATLKAKLRSNKRHHLPVGEVTGKEDDTFAARQCGFCNRHLEDLQ